MKLCYNCNYGTVTIYIRIYELIYRFSARNTIMFACSGFSCALCELTIWPALLKSLSDGELLAEIATVSIFDIRDYLFPFPAFRSAAKQRLAYRKPSYCRDRMICSYACVTMFQFRRIYLSRCWDDSYMKRAWNALHWNLSGKATMHIR